MQTTNLFVELLLIGIGAAIWMLLFFAFWGFDVNVVLVFITNHQIIGAGFSIAILYILGILTDRLADRMFESRNRKISREFYEHYDDLLADRVTIYQAASPLVENLSYGRSRMRICRGWLFNLFIILILGNIAVLIQGISSGDWSTFFLQFSFLNVTTLLLGYGFYFAWKNLTIKEYSKVKKISTLLREDS